MGKKGKRSRRKAVIAANQAFAIDVNSKYRELNDKIRKSCNYNLFSQAADELREGIQWIEAKTLEANDTLRQTSNVQTWQTWLFESKILLYSNFMRIELGRYNFSAVIQMYENLSERGDLKMQMKNLPHLIPSVQLPYHQALLKQGNGSIDESISVRKLLTIHGMQHDETLEPDLLHSVGILRITKHFDEAIVLGKRLEVLTGDRLSLAITYLEQYRDCDKKSNHLPESIFLDMDYALQDVLQKHKYGGFNTCKARPSMALVQSSLVLAQWTYLRHQRYDDEEKENYCWQAILFLEKYFDSFWSSVACCDTCNQTVTESEVQFVCSGCRVACYCSIDHQRRTWKKDAVRGMRIGHEILCPVMKAYRKCRNAYFNSEDDEKISRLRRQFEKECLYFLSDGLDLKDKCFPK